MSAQADFEYWSLVPHCTLDEAIALSFGKAPEEVKWAKLKDIVQISTFAAQYSRHRELALRALAASQLSDPVVPADFLSWAGDIGIVVPAQLVAAVDASPRTALWLAA